MIGLIMNIDRTINNNEVYTLYSAFTKIIDKKIIGIPKQNIDNMIDIINMCDKIIFQGGNDYTDIDLKILRYLYDMDKPVLGICLGMQAMSILFNGKLGKIEGHNKKTNYVHGVSIKSNSKLYSIIGSNYILVNSRHNDYVCSTNLDIVGISNVIEAVEDSEKKFFIGVQWHPENMYCYDTSAKKLIDYFVKI